MRRRAGYVLVLGGAAISFAAWLFRSPASISVNGYTADAFLVEEAAGIVVMGLGILLVRRTA